MGDGILVKGSAVDGNSGHPLSAYGRWCQQNSLLRLVASVWQEETVVIPGPLSLATGRETFSSLKTGKRLRAKSI